MRHVLMLGFIAVLAFTGSAQAQAATPLVDTAWVVANAGRSDVVILDVRNKPARWPSGRR